MSTSGLGRHSRHTESSSLAGDLSNTNPAKEMIISHSNFLTNCTYVIVMNTISGVIVLMHHCLGYRVFLDTVRKIKLQI